MIAKTIGAIALSAALALSTGFTNKEVTASNGTNSSTEITKNCSPTPDLEVTAIYDRNELGKSKLKGSIYNRSLEQDYDNVQLQVNFYDVSGAQISSQVLVMNKDIGAGKAEDFSLAFTSPVGAESATWNIICAEEDGWF